MDLLVQKIKQTTLSVAEQLTPVLKESKFKEGRITPDEFIHAGDHLVHLCPTWQWSIGDATKIKDYLPKEKQFLVTKNVPCLKRCKEIEIFGTANVLENVEEEDGWVMHKVDEDNNSKTSEMIINNAVKVVEPDDDDDEQEALDMEEFDLDTVDPSAIIRPSIVKLNEEDDSRVHTRTLTRTYDLYIVYNKFYQTPHFFLIGYDENLQVLNIDQMNEDVSQDNVKKTVTYEAHPHLETLMLAVHPCKHSELMKKFIQIAEEGGNELFVHSYLILFLKFVQSVIPTINYDFSQMIKTN